MDYIGIAQNLKAALAQYSKPAQDKTGIDEAEVVAVMLEKYEILLDEPGLTLHGKAQSDLLRYIEERILPELQVIYTTHSPFMVPAQRLEDVLVVEDVVDYRDHVVPSSKARRYPPTFFRLTRIRFSLCRPTSATKSLSPYLFGQNCLLVEGPSDVVYLQVVSRALQARGRTGLDERWTNWPTGGLDKAWSFSSLFRGNNLNIAVLCDYGKGDKSKVERLRQSQILKSERVLTAADFTEKPESDVEDLFDSTFHCTLVN